MHIVQNLDNAVTKAYAEQNTDEIIDLWFLLVDTSYTLSAATAVDDEQISVTDATGLSIGDIICIKEKARYYQGFITGITGTDIDLDTPLDEEFTTAAIVFNGVINMNVDGSGTIQKFKIAPPDQSTWHVHRLIFTMTDDSAMDDSKFGGITALTSGLLIRASNGIKKNIANIKKNQDFASISSDIAYSDKAPAGQYGFRCRTSFNGPDKRGAVISLIGNDADTLEIWVRDNLTGLLSLNCRAQGHRVSA